MTDQSKANQLFPEMESEKPKNKARKHVPDQAAYDTEIRLMTQMNTLDYEARRVEASEKFGVRASEIDRAVRKLRAKQTSTRANQLQAPKPWPSAVEGEAHLRNLREVLNRYCILPDGADLIISLWILFAHAHDAFLISPILAIQSPEKRCGKSTLLEVISELVPKPLVASNATAASIFRSVDRFKPTLIMDEADTFIHGSDELRGIVNSGHRRRTAFVVRTIGDDHEPTQMSTWGPKVIAGIGTFPDTIQDRAIVIPMRRKANYEQVARFREQEAIALEPLLRKSARWVKDNFGLLRQANPALPEELNDRAQDNAAGILAIADLISAEVGQEARAVLMQMAQQLAAQEDLPPNTQLLVDLRDIFIDSPKGEWTSKEVIEALCKIEESPWPTWHRGRPIIAKQLASILRSFCIFIHKTSHARVYRVADFQDAFERYLRPD